MTKLNCWQYTRCGRQPGGAQAAALGVCPVALERRLSGVNSGECAGRACWAVGGTFCQGEKQGTYAQKLGDCIDCKFYQLVHGEETPCFTTMAILDKIRPRHDDE
ncbi:MAG: hypothetical protein HQK81_08885 [Desulfovibrionaceae bacterium]|nr:hypothetical protein [Desulfovibrionaceae bacterium]MBF0514164.1 hypothetical protein [Desulfovibrionaceae bacterium]